MPFEVRAGESMLFVRKNAFERHGLTREAFDRRLNLTADEFRVEGGLIVIGPIHDDAEVRAVLQELEDLGLVYFDDYFELSGNWPEWLRLFALGAQRSAPT